MYAETCKQFFTIILMTRYQILLLYNKTKTNVRLSDLLYHVGDKKKLIQFLLEAISDIYTKKKKKKNSAKNN